MVIKNISFTSQARRAILSADLVFQGKKPEHVYLATDAKYKNYIASDASPFLAAVLLPCMKKGENIHIEGSISQQLYQNSQKIMQLVGDWNLGLKQISITAEKIAKDKTKPKHEAAFFSGGVDSFYTYLKHQTKISHFILIHGFDIDQNNKLFFNKVLENVKKIAKQAKTKVITIETNMTPIIESKLVWDYAHGGALAAVALMLRKELKDIYISSAVRHDQLFPYGTHPLLDKYWSTEQQTIHHDGTEYTRFEKIVHTLSKSPLALKHLRVCNQNIKGKYNCSKCFKCLITMIELKSAGILDQVPTFSHHLDLEKVRQMRYDYKLKYNLLVEICLDQLRKENREPALQEAIKESLEKSKRTSLNQHIIQSIAHMDQTYNERRLYQWIFKMNKNQDRNIIFKTLARKGIIK